MFRNILKILFRNLLRHKTFSLLNILGLAVGMAAFFLIFLYVSFETSYDNFHSKTDRIYRIVTDTKTPSETIKHARTTAPITSILVAFSTISYQAIKAAIANPVKSLRTE